MSFKRFEQRREWLIESERRCEEGWIRVEIPQNPIGDDRRSITDKIYTDWLSNEIQQSHDIDEWIKQHVKHDHMHWDREYIFESGEEALAFILRWL